MKTVEEEMKKNEAFAVDRFKFRVFDEDENKMFYFTFDDLIHAGIDIVYQSSSVLYDAINKSEHIMQSTGLKDKNGVLIYEGDIVENEVCAKRAVCRSDDGSYRLFTLYKPTTKWIVSNTSETFKSFQKSKWKVIGNTHEISKILK